MINNLYSIGSSALQNAQVSVDNASNNIANADTTGYQRTDVVYETGDSITINGLTVGTGATISSIEAQRDDFIEEQYLDAAAELATQTSALEYQSQLDTLFNETDSGLSTLLSDYFTSWSELATDPDSLSAREELLGTTESLVYALNSSAENLENIASTIESEISSEVDEANEIIEQIASLNSTIANNSDDTQAISERDQLIRDLNDIVGVEVITDSNGEVTVLTEEGYTLVDGTETHSLVYSGARATSALTRASEYSGEIAYSGTSSEEILIEFVTSGEDGTAQFKVSLDGGETWVEDENGDTMLYTADDEDGSVEIEGVEIWFENGSGDHEVGDKYTIVAKDGIYWESSSGGLVNITPLTDESGDYADGRVSSGSLAGLYAALDDSVRPTLDEINDITEALIWETNTLYSQGAGLEQHTALTGSYAVDDSSAALSNSGLYFEDNIQAGEIQFITYDEDGEVSTNSVISIDPSDSLDDVADLITNTFAGELTAEVVDGQLVISSESDMTFEIAGDTSNLLAALGINTYFTGTDAETISIDSYVASDTSHLNTAVAGDDGTVSSGNNDIASAMVDLSETDVSIGGTTATLSEGLAALVAEIGATAQSTELKQTYAATSADYYYEQQASTSEVNVDEELISLTKYQQAYQAAAEIISVTREMMDTILDMV